MDQKTSKTRNLAIPLFVITAVLVIGVLFAFSASGSGVGEGGLFDHEESDLDYDPDYEIPENDFKIFYSDTPLPETDEEEGDEDEVEFDDPELGEPRPIDEIMDEEHGDPEEYAGAVDVSYYITPSLMEFYGWTLADYRHNQLEGFHFDTSESHILEDWEGETEDNGTIEDAYLGIIGLSPGGHPQFQFGGTQSADQFDRNLLAADDGEVLTYLDFQLDDDAVPDEEVDDEITHTVLGEDDRQTQDRRTYVIENYGADRDLIIDGDRTIRFHMPEGVGGLSLEYEDTFNQDVSFDVEGEVWAEIYEYDWERERDKIHDERTTRVSGSTTETEEATATLGTTVNHGPDSEGEDISADVSGPCTTSASGTVDKTVERTWSELDGDRTIDIEEDVSFDVTGSISGTCSGTVEGTASSGNSTYISGEVSEDISGSVSGSELKTFEYQYWDHWDSVLNSDNGGWQFQDTELERTDSVDVEDSIDAYITDNNDVDVEQVAIEVEEDERYHTVVQLDYDGIRTYDHVLPGDMEDMYYWSMLMFDDQTYIDSDWKSYSYTRYGETYDGESFPNQLGVDVFSEEDGPSMTSVGEDTHQNPELYGWEGDIAYISTYNTHENATFESKNPAFYHTFVVRNAPEPASELISIHGSEREIQDSETREVPYVQPDVTIDHNTVDDSVEVTVTGENGEPLSGRDLVVEGSDGDSELTTNNAGQVEFDVGHGINHIQVEVQGDSLDNMLQGEIPEEYYGSVTAQKTVGFAGVPGHLYDAIMQIMFSIPLVLFYLLWRDAELGI